LASLDPQVSVEFPHGTVSAIIDYELGVMRIFSEPEPHWEDWAEAKIMAASIAGGGWDCFDDGGVDVFDVRIVPDVRGMVA
jgi:hypothetical protein